MQVWLLVFWWIILVEKAHGTIDVNLSELEYLAGRLNVYECRRLIAALHYTSYELPRNVAEAERRVNEEIPCLQQLLHWNSWPGEGRGKSHEWIVHRLRQIGRNDLADWLGKTAFKQLANDLERAMDQPFNQLPLQSSSDTSLGRVEPPDVAAIEEDPWADLNTVLVAILLGLLATLISLICITLVYKIKKHFRPPNKNRKNADPIESESRQSLIMSKKKTGKCATQCRAHPAHLKHDNQTDDTDLG